MAEDFEREERAFAEALRGSVPVESFRPLDPEKLKAAAGPATASRRPWLKGLAAAAAVVVVVGAGAAILPQLFGAGSYSSATVAGLPEAAGGAAPMEAQDGSTAAAEASPVALAGNWAKASGGPLSPRSNAAGAWLAGEFFLVGGQSNAPCPPGADCIAPEKFLKDGAAYNPVTDVWRRIADAPAALSEGEPVVVAGRLYFQRGYGSKGAIYAYDATSDTWSRPPSPSGGGVLAALGDRLVSVARSTEDAGAHDELYDQAAGRWTRLPADPLKASFERTLVWVDGRALLFAKDVATKSSDRAPVFRVAELDLATGKWQLLGDSGVVGVGGRAVGNLVVFPESGTNDGGEVHNWGRDYPTGGIYDPATAQWSELPGPTRPDDGTLREAGTSVAGGLLLTDGRLLDPVQRRWIHVPQPPAGNLLGQTVVAGPASILVFGGWDGHAATNGTFHLPLR